MTESHPPIQQNPPCIYTQLDNGINSFIFTKPSRATIDAFVEQMHSVFATKVSGEVVPCLIDWRQSGIPPLPHLSRRGREFLRHHPTGAYGRIAFLTNQGTLVNIAQALLNTVNTKAQKRFFRDDQYNEAVDWLLEN